MIAPRKRAGLALPTLLAPGHPGGADRAPRDPGRRAGLTRAGLTRAGLTRAGLTRAGLTGAPGPGGGGHLGSVGLVTLVSRRPLRRVLPDMMTTLVDCPECGLPATSRSEGRVASTAGPVEHIHLRCVVGHRFFGPSEMLLHRRRGR